jgi:membrane protease YdiL (CAAX protease family)
MNILVTLGVALFALCLLWAVQSIVLALAGEPLALPFRFKTRKPLVRYASRTMIHVSWLIILAGTQIALGIPLLDALHQAFPTPLPWHDMALAFAIMFVPATLMYVLYVLLGWARFEPQGETAKRRGKLFRRFVGPWPLATLEEAVFRGVLLEQFIRSLPASRGYALLAIVVVAAAFSFVHFIKPRAGRSAWQMAWGYFIVGCLFGLGYVAGGRSLWVPIVLHGAAVFVIEIARLYIVFEKPPWLMGYGESPQSGVVGTLVILGMAIAVVTLISA